MKHFFILFSFALSWLQLEAQEQQIKKEVPPFKKVTVSSGINAFLYRADQPSIAIEGEALVIQKVSFVVEGDQLILQMKGPVSWKNSAVVTVRVYFTELDGIAGAGGSDIRCEDAIASPWLEVNAQSGSDIWLNVNVQQLKVQGSSGSDVRLIGKARQAQARISSGSALKAAKLQTELFRVDTSSGSEAQVWVTHELNANAESGSSIVFSGNPPVKHINRSSGGDVVME